MSEFVDCRTCKTDCVRADGNYGYTFCDKYTHSPMTNADRIRSMTDEELAKLLLDGCRGSKCDDQPKNEWGNVNCFQCRLEWLQQPAEEDAHD